MSSNPTVKKLGFSDSDRIVIIHTDDIGMCHASVGAFADLFNFGLISSGAVMMPCPWALEAVEFQRNHPQADLGIHVTLTSEWKNYRWGPLSTRESKTGLMDEQGFFHRRSSGVQANADPAGVALEIETQVQRALAAGMTPSHMDTHMGSVAHPKFMQTYINIALKYHLPPMVFRWGDEQWRQRGMDALAATAASQYIKMLEANGLPLLDHMSGLPLDQPEDRLGQAKSAFQQLQPGITHFIIHPSKDTPELRAITPDWVCRVGDYQTFLMEELKSFIKQSGIQVIGYRDIQKIMPGG